MAVEAKQENGAIGQTKPNPALFTNAPPGFSGLLLNASITTIDIPAFRYQLHLEVGPKGGLASTDNLGRITRSLQLWINGKVTPIQAGQPAFPMDIPISFESGSVNMYPIDSFHSTLKIYAFLVDNSTATNTPIPVALIFAGALQSWTIKSSLEIQENEMNLKIKVIRSATTIFFSIFIILVMWALSLTLLILAVTLWMRKRKVEPPTMSVAAALLFALPSIRSTQPGIPSIGCTADAMGFLCKTNS